MHNTLLTALAGLALVAALLIAGVFSGSGVQPSGQPAPVSTESVEQAAHEVVEEPALQPRKRARVRASLSMPYFSFAQSLRTRG